jgi:osmotically inducible protein OsmC
MAFETLFTATSRSAGGRNGRATALDGTVDVNLSIPKSMGGPGRAETTTPEHLFATGYAACFGGAVDFVATQHKKSGRNVEVECAVTLGKSDGRFALAVKMKVTDRSIPTAELEKFVKIAHETVCPYSHATRGNVPVEFEVVGA